MQVPPLPLTRMHICIRPTPLPAPPPTHTLMWVPPPFTPPPQTFSQSMDMSKYQTLSEEHKVKIQVRVRGGVNVQGVWGMAVAQLWVQVNEWGAEDP